MAITTNMEARFLMLDMGEDRKVGLNSTWPVTGFYKTNGAFFGSGFT